MRSTLLEDASGELGQRFFDIVRRRDRKALICLITRDYPEVFWGKYFNILSQEDQRWALMNLAR